jgi:hypothetical protein
MNYSQQAVIYLTFDVTEVLDGAVSAFQTWKTGTQRAVAMGGTL